MSDEIYFAVVDPMGRVLRCGQCHPALLSVQARDELGEVVFQTEGKIDDTRSFYSHTAEAFVAMPPSAGPWAVFDTATETWVDPRTPADLAAELQARRAAVSLSRTAFILACIDARLLASEDAVDASRGVLPPAFAAMFDTIPEAERLEMSGRWGAATTIARLDPMILELADMMRVAPEQLDAIFGITAGAA